MGEVMQALTECREGTLRIQKIVNSLRTFSRQEVEVHLTDLGAAVEVSLQMAMHEMRPKARVSFENHVTARILGNESKLAQVLVNLLVNAAQAFEANNPERNAIYIEAFEEGDHVLIRIKDNGPGIEAEVLPRIFDPVFTTKPVGQGTGLGLSISQSIVRELGRRMACESKPGRGTVFEVWLPSTGRERGEASDIVAIRTPRGKILIIDDEVISLRAMKRLLSPIHDVTIVSDPREALERLRQGERYDLILCDLMMPHLSGPDLLNQVSVLDEDVAGRFVVISGGATRPEWEEFLAKVPNERLEKPVSTPDLRNLAENFEQLSGSRSLPPARLVV